METLYTIEILDSNNNSLGFLNVEDPWTPKETWSINPKPIRGWASEEAAEITWLQYRGLHKEQAKGCTAKYHTVTV